MSESQGRAGKYIFWGCAAILMIPILAVLAVAVRTWIPLRVAGSNRADLEIRFGAPGSFAPAPDGGLSPDRVEAFLQVRRSMMELCPRFEDLEVTLRRLDREMTAREPQSGREIVQVASTLVGALGDLTPLVGDFFRQRNEALMEAEMGIGEYIYLFTIAYGKRLTEGDVRGTLFADGVSLSPEARTALRSMLVLQLARLSATEEADEFRAALAQEIAALDEDPGRVPWQDHLPDPTLSSLAPYRERLDSQFCPETAGMEVDPDPDRAMAIALD